MQFGGAIKRCGLFDGPWSWGFVRGGPGSVRALAPSGLGQGSLLQCDACTPVHFCFAYDRSLGWSQTCVARFALSLRHDVDSEKRVLDRFWTVCRFLVILLTGFPDRSQEPCTGECCLCLEIAGEILTFLTQHRRSPGGCIPSNWICGHGVGPCLGPDQSAEHV